ncbi:MAG TPA: MarR family transcriptional regulator [Mycobacteriales bacterium]|nr:MarR family transcriptional regulator [Mycobacteriales bacterium]
MDEPSVESLSDELVTCLEDLISVLRQLPADPDLSLNAALVVRHCVANGPTRVSVLAEQLGVSQPAATQLVDRLQAEGWVRRTADADDRRAVLTVATATGRRRLAKRHATRVRSVAQGVRELDASQQRLLQAAAPALKELVSTLKSITRNGDAA